MLSIISNTIHLSWFKIIGLIFKLKIEKENIDEMIEKITKTGEFNNETVFHSLTWLKIIGEKEAKKQQYILCVYSQNRIIAYMPIFERALWAFSSLRGCYGGWAFKKEVNTLALNLITLPLFYHIYDFSSNKQFYQFASSRKLSTWILNIENYNYVFNSIVDSKTRNQVRRSLALGVLVKKVSISNVDRMMELYEDLTLKHNIQSPFGKDFFMNCAGNSSEEVITYGAFVEDRLVGFSIFIKNEISVFYYINCSDRNYSKFNTPNAILNFSLSEFSKQGIKTCNMGAAPPGNNGLIHFKKNWGAVEVEYNFYSKIPLKLEKILQNMRLILRKK